MNIRRSSHNVTLYVNCLPFLIPESRVLEDIILGNLISAIKNGSDCLGNPPLDPFNYEENISFENLELFDLAL
jgi:hypothetical protein